LLLTMVRETLQYHPASTTNTTPSIPLTRQHMYIMSEHPLTSGPPIRLSSHRDPRAYTLIINTDTAKRTHHFPTPHTKSLPHPRLARHLAPTPHHPRPHQLRESILPLPEAPERASRSSLQQILLLQKGHARGRRVEAQSQEPPHSRQRHRRLQRLWRRGVERRSLDGRPDRGA
jgi:hypothetical protein